MPSIFSSMLFLKTPPRETLPVGLKIGLTAFLFILFGFSDLLILLSSEWPHLYGAVGVPVQKWEEIVIYAPFAEAFSWHNLFPIAPAVDKSLSGWSVYPWITIFLQGVLHKIFAFRNIDLYMLLSHGALPVLNFWLIYLVFKRYVSKAWAILLSFLGVTYYSNFHYAESLGVLFGAGSKGASVFHYSLPEITRTPFPSLSLLLFLVPFYLTVYSNRLDSYRLAFLSLLWGLQIYVYAFNFLAGGIFFALWIAYAHYVNEKTFRPGKLAKSLSVFLLACAVIGIPYFASSVSVLGKQLSGKLFEPAHGALVTSGWSVLVSYGLPISLLAFAFFLFRGDYYELFYRYTPVLIAVFVDLLIGSVHLLTGNRINPELYYHRISNIVFRFFYFIPFLYFIGLPEKRVSAPVGGPLQSIHGKAPDLLRRYIHRYRGVYCVIGMALLSLYIFINGVYVFKMHEKIVAPQMRESQRGLDAVKHTSVEQGAVVVYEDIVSNLVGPAITKNTTLLASTFGNFVEDRLILERICLYSKLFSWSEERFLTFMEPTEKFMNLTSYKSKELIVSREMMESGLGYWLVNHRKRMSREEREKYRERITRYFRESSLEELLGRNPVGVILVRNSDRESLKKFRQSRIGDYTLIYPKERNS